MSAHPISAVVYNRGAVVHHLTGNTEVLAAAAAALAARFEMKIKMNLYLVSRIPCTVRAHTVGASSLCVSVMAYV